MKAILVIDMPDNLKNHLDKVKVDVIGTLNGHELFHRLNQPLKPMPIKQEMKSTIGIDLVDGFKDGWNYGWNACLEEIEKWQT